MKTKICELLGIEYPILQGAMAWIADGHLAGHVSKAGGLGIIAGGGMPIEILEKEIDIAKEITDKPFGVNLMLMMADIEKQVDICIEKGVKVVTTGAGNPGPYMEKLLGAGIKVIPVIPSVALAKRMERIGAHAVIAEGTEAGGHIGQITTMSLLPQVVEAVGIPVIAAGGIAVGKQVLATLAMGAEGVQIGTRFIVADECNVHDNYKEAVIKAKDRSTVSTGNHTGHPVRVINNKLSKKMIDLEKVGAPQEELEELGRGALKLAAIDGDIHNGSIMAGQVASMITKRETCKDAIEEIIQDTKRELNVLKFRF